MNKSLIFIGVLISIIILYAQSGQESADVVVPHINHGADGEYLKKQSLVSLSADDKPNEEPEQNVSNLNQKVSNILSANDNEYAASEINYSDAKLEDNLDILQQDELDEKEKARIDEGFKDFFESVTNKDWDALMKNTEDFKIDGLEDKAMLTFALTQAVSRGAPLDILLNLLNRGAEFNAEILFAVAIRQDVNIAQAFVDYGLNLHQRDAQDRSALYYAMSNLRTKNMFEYLVANGVSTNIAVPENDLISAALTGCNASNNVDYFIKRLLSLGEKIQAAHRRMYLDLVLNNGMCVKKISPYFAL